MNDMKTKTKPTPQQLYQKLDRIRCAAERAVTKIKGPEGSSLPSPRQHS
jgi:hypothetical protein